MFDVQSLDGMFPKMNQIYLELSEMRNFLKCLRSVLVLEETASVNACMKALQMMMSDNNSNKNINNDESTAASTKVKENESGIFCKWNSIFLSLRTLLDVSDEDLIVDECTQLMERCKDYEAVFPRVHNLINQLRSTLGVEHAHEILPRVKQMCAASSET